MDFNVDIEMGENGPETEVRVSLDRSLIEELADKVREIDLRYGPDRSVGPVTIILRQGEQTEVLIETQKQGTVECYLTEYGRLIER